MPALKRALREINLADPVGSWAALTKYARTVKGARIFDLLGKMEDIRAAVGTTEALRILKRVETVEEIDDLHGLAKVAGKRTRGVMELTGKPRTARAVMEGYTKMFLPALLRKGGHPAIAARKIGPYFDAWGVPPDPGWSIVGYMRYRSRRDLAKLVANPRFGGAHDFKFAAMPQTFSFPTRPMIMTLASPRIAVGLALGCLAGVTQNAIALLA